MAKAREVEVGAGPGAHIAALATRQHGVIAYRQLRLMGLSERAIAHRVRAGSLHRAHRGVYLVGHQALAPLARHAAGLLAIGPGSSLTYETAGVLSGMCRERDGPIHVSLVTHGRVHRPGIRVHKLTAELPKDEQRVHDGLPVTAPARTLLDLASVLPARELGWALEEALRTRVVLLAGIEEILRRYPRRRGAHRLRELVTEHSGDPALTRSEAERRLLDLVRDAGLPQPATNVRLLSYEVDALWPAQNLVVEVDGFAFHGTRAAFERDRNRDAQLQLAGYRVLRLTWRQITRDQLATVGTLARALG